jgi:hypothetical protein
MTEFTAEVDLVAVFVTVAVRTSDGPGPGPKRVPPGEAAALVGEQAGGVRRSAAVRVQRRRRAGWRRGPDDAGLAAGGCRP